MVYASRAERGLPNGALRRFDSASSTAKDCLPSHRIAPPGSLGVGTYQDPGTIR
jgi:hypothetical protein